MALARAVNGCVPYTSKRDWEGSPFPVKDQRMQMQNKQSFISAFLIEVTIAKRESIENMLIFRLILDWEEALPPRGRHTGGCVIVRI